MRDTLNIECLIESLNDYLEAKNEHDKARDNFDGYSWGYHGSSYINKVDDAAENFQKRLDEYISDIVDKKLNEVPK